MQDEGEAEQQHPNAARWSLGWPRTRSSKLLKRISILLESGDMGQGGCLVGVVGLWSPCPACRASGGAKLQDCKTARLQVGCCSLVCTPRNVLGAVWERWLQARRAPPRLTLTPGNLDFWVPPTLGPAIAQGSSAPAEADWHRSSLVGELPRPCLLHWNHH